MCLSLVPHHLSSLLHNSHKKWWKDRLMTSLPLPQLEGKISFRCCQQEPSFCSSQQWMTKMRRQRKVGRTATWDWTALMRCTSRLSSQILMASSAEISPGLLSKSYHQDPRVSHALTLQCLHYIYNSSFAVCKVNVLFPLYLHTIKDFSLIPRPQPIACITDFTARDGLVMRLARSDLDKFSLSSEL